MSDFTPLDLFYDDLDWIERHCCIITKAGTIEPIRFNYAQGKVIEACVGQLKAGLPIRIVCLKARQLGISTFIQALMFARSARRSGVRGVLIAHQDDSTKKIWRMQSVFAGRSGSAPFIKSFAEADGPLVWQHNSRLSCMTAGGKDIAHGETITFLHLSEASRYGEGQSPDQQARVVQTIVGINAAVAKTPDSAVFIESTANGYGNWFEGMWHKAKGGKVEYAPVFIAWHENPEYRRGLHLGPIHRVEDLDSTEIALRDQFDLALEQLNWRRHTIANDCNGDERLFREQYPASDEEAFLVSGSTVFDAERIGLYLQNVRPPVWRGDIEFVPPCGWRLTPDSRGPLKVWRWCERDEDERATDAYVIGADSARCLDNRSDLDAAVVGSARTSDIVCTLEGRWEPGVYALKLAALGYLYGEAYLAPESNETGGAVIGALRGRLGGDPLYRNLHRYERVDKASGARSLEYGFQTNVKSKRAAIEAQAALWREGTQDCPSEDILLQAKTFINLSHGKMGAQPNCHDDLITATCIVAAVLDKVNVPSYASPRPRRVDDLLERDELTAEEMMEFSQQ